VARQNRLRLILVDFHLCASPRIISPHHGL
jgi:hypothetical protein